jgi:hypothetical protein
MAQVDAGEVQVVDTPTRRAGCCHAKPFISNSGNSVRHFIFCAVRQMRL